MKAMATVSVFGFTDCDWCGIGRRGLVTAGVTDLLCDEVQRIPSDDSVNQAPITGSDRHQVIGNAQKRGVGPLHQFLGYGNQVIGQRDARRPVIVTKHGDAAYATGEREVNPDVGDRAGLAHESICSYRTRLRSVTACPSADWVVITSGCHRCRLGPIIQRGGPHLVAKVWNMALSSYPQPRSACFLQGDANGPLALGQGGRSTPGGYPRGAVILATCWWRGVRLLEQQEPESVDVGDVRPDPLVSDQAPLTGRQSVGVDHVLHKFYRSPDSIINQELAEIAEDHEDAARGLSRCHVGRLSDRRPQQRLAAEGVVVEVRPEQGAGATRGGHLPDQVEHSLVR